MAEYGYAMTMGVYPEMAYVPHKALPDDERAAANSLLSAVVAFTEVRGKMPLQYLATFLLVAIREGQSVNDYARQAGVHKNVMSRQIIDLSVKSRHQETPNGLGLLTSQPSSESLRQHEVYLTPKGRSLMQKILRAWQLRREIKE